MILKGLGGRRPRAGWATAFVTAAGGVRAVLATTWAIGHELSDEVWAVIDNINVGAVWALDDHVLPPHTYDSGTKTIEVAKCGL